MCFFLFLDAKNSTERLGCVNRPEEGESESAMLGSQVKLYGCGEGEEGLKFKHKLPVLGKKTQFFVKVLICLIAVTINRI